MSAFAALLVKELRQLRRNRQVLALIFLPPMIQLIVFGASLSPELRHVPLAVCDQQHDVRSRELLSALVRGGTFDAVATTASPAAAAALVRNGTVAGAIIVPADLSRRIAAGERPAVQLLLDGVNGYVAGLSGAYARQILAHAGVGAAVSAPPLALVTTYAFNPGLVSSWFFVPGIMAAILFLISIIVAAVETIRDKETGTIEQLLMTPASSLEVVAAKMIPLFTVMLVTLALEIAVARLGFRLPFRGDAAAFALASALVIAAGVGLGVLLATLTRNRRQVILTAIFVAVPLIQLSGALAPVESMPPAIRTATLLNPLRHYATVVRDAWLKPVSAGAYLGELLFLAAFAALTVAISAAWYRRQLR